MPHFPEGLPESGNGLPDGGAAAEILFHLHAIGAEKRFCHYYRNLAPWGNRSLEAI
jgi:hypothetical protein